MTGRIATSAGIRPLSPRIGGRSPWWAAPVIAVAALLPQPVRWPVVTAAIILLGVPHGALDGEICRTLLRPRCGRAWFAVFAIPYMLLFAAVLAAWRLAPCWTLLGFLLASAWHFGTEDAPPAGGLEVLVRGGLPIAVPMLAHPAAPLLLFATMAATPLGPAPWEGAVGACWLVLAGLWALGLFAAGQPRRLAMPALLSVIFVVLPPLPAFAIYFVCVHAPAHTARLIGDPVRAPRVRDGRSALVLALPITVLTLAIGAALWPFYPGAVPSRLLTLTIQMLAALTLPHMLLEAVLDRRDRVAARHGRRS